MNEADFRYSGGLPKSKEAGIVMLADSVEATVKSFAKPTPKLIEDAVTDTINRKLDDGQFDECDLTTREIHEVGEAILEALVGILGPRIQYPGKMKTLKIVQRFSAANPPTGSRFGFSFRRTCL